jgi:formylglycine-generating enzyme required for sulfatase activity/serine/threonine protein kinase
MDRMGTSHVDWVPPERFAEYQLIKALGRGSMGQVWLAHDAVLDRLVAVKFVSELPDHEAVRQRFLTEARAAARVQHPNVIAIYRVGEIGARPYLISEYVRGDSLDRIARPVPWPRILDIAIGLARGLAAAHLRGVLHRDLKPANAILSETGEVKLLDFGLAKLVAHAQPPTAVPPGESASVPDRAGDPTIPPRPASDQVAPPPPSDRPTQIVEAGVSTTEATRATTTATGDAAVPQLASSIAALGTPTYTPPEVWCGAPATSRGDVYSLGTLLYELAAGVPPHRGDSQQTVRSSVVETDAPPLATAAPGIDPRFAAIVDRCLRRDPDERFASEALRDALEALAGGDRDAAPLPAHARPDRARLRLPHRSIALAVAALVGLGLGLAGDHRRGRGRGRAVRLGPCPDGMILVPAGTFQMGSPDGSQEADPDEHPQHAVRLSSYCIERTEVTVAAYAVCAAAGACSPAPEAVNWSAYTPEDALRYSRWCNRSDRPDHPINCIDWELAAAYCAWRGGRLPTEAEWEYAARGSDDRVYPWGNEAPGAKRLNMCGRECAALAARELHDEWKPMYDGDDGWATTAPVGSYRDGASPFGVLDMAGNVWEWTDDWHGPYPATAQVDPRGRATGTSRVSRGAGWASRGPTRARGADRNWLDPKSRDCDLGFRCVQD